MQVSIGRILQYKLTEEDVQRIARRRTDSGSIGNPHHAGQVLPLVVCVVWPNEYGPNYHGVNGQVLLDGNDSYWVTSIKEGSENGTWAWPIKTEDSAPDTKEAV
jgi:hypothetical protein